jgi:peptidoglycan/xylan/chitin deacetylase (PgdA/CDA1 family)
MDITSSEGKRIIKRMYNEGHEIASHTYSHASLASISRSKIREEITKLDEKIKDIIGVKPAFIRPPYGEGAGSSTVQTELKSLGYTAIILWNVDTMDWSNKGDIDYAISKFNEKLGKPIISLNHCYYEGISKESLIKSAREEIKYMKSKGYTPVTMSECLGLEPYQ